MTTNKISVKYKFFLPLPFCVLIFFFNSVSAKEIVQKPDYVYSICESVVDSNTIKVNILGKIKDLRLIGVKAEGKGGFLRKVKKMLGSEDDAVSFLKKNVKGKAIFLEFGREWANPKKTLEGYVRLKEGGMFVNMELIRKGYAAADTKNNYKYKKDFLKAEREKRK